MRLQVNGKQYETFVSAQASSRLDALSATFAFSAASADATALQFDLGQACQVFVDGEQVLSGFIELINVGGSAREHSIDIQGRDKTGDLLDSSMDSLNDLKAPITLSSVCRRVIKHIGADIGVVDQTFPEAFQAAEDVLSVEPGDNAFAFLDRLARKRQVLLTHDFNGNLVISSTSAEDTEGRLIHRVGDPANNVLRYSASYDSTGRFNRYKLHSQRNPLAVALSGAKSSKSSIASPGSSDVTDSDIRQSRQMILVSEAFSSGPEANRRALWERNMRRARGRTYSCTVPGYRHQGGDLWTPNTRAFVDDEYVGIRAKMLVNSVSFNLSLDGMTTDLTFVEPDAYRLELDEPMDQEIGRGFSS